MTTITAAPRRNAFKDILIVMGRELRPVTSDPSSIVVGMIQPLFFLLLFGPLVAATGSNLQYDMQGGSHERLLVTPLTRSSLFIGRSLKEFVPIIMQAVVIVLVMIPLGFRPNIPGGALGLLLVGILGVGIGSLSYA